MPASSQKCAPAFCQFCEYKSRQWQQMLSSGDWAGEKRDGEDEEGDKGNHPLGNENQIVTKALENKRL